MAIKHNAINSRKDMVMVNPMMVNVVDKWNPRTEFDKDDLEGLMNSIIANGVMVPIRVKINKDNEMILIDGERRLRATKMAIDKGYEVNSIPAILERKTMKETDMIIIALTTNTGMPLKPFEEADAISRLVNFGMSVKEVAFKLGKSVQHISNRLKLLDVTPEVKEAVKKKEITLKDATDIVDTSSGDTKEQNNKLIVKKVLKKAGIKKASRSECFKILVDMLDDLKDFSSEYPQLCTYVDQIEYVIKREEI